MSVFSAPAWSGEIAGLWQAYNEETGNPEALIRIEKTADNFYEGRIEKILPDEAAALRCSHCTGNLHNQPLLNLSEATSKY